MSETTSELIRWILPPVLGAIIGYITNAIAIRMLFRPYREWRVLRVRVPFTPGIIPRQRYKLAESIGKMVSNELLTEDTLRKQVRSESFRVGLNTAVSRLTDGLLDATVGDLVRRRTDGGRFDLLPALEALIRGLLRSAAFKRIVDVIVLSGLRSLTAKKIGDLFGGEEQKERFIAWIVGLLRAPDTGKALLAKTTDWIGRNSEANTPLGDYIPPEATDWIVGIADLLYEPFFGFVTEWLESDLMRAQIETRGRVLLKNILDKLSVLQRFFVVAAQYDRTLDEKMPEIIDDVLASMKEIIEDETTRGKMIQTIRDNLESLRGRSVGDVNESYRITERFAHALNAVQKTIAGDPAGDSLRALLRTILKQLENRSIESFLEHALTVEDAAAYLSKLIATSVHETADRISKEAIEHIGDIVDNKGKTSLRTLVGISDEAKSRFDNTLSQMADKALEERITDILDSLDLNGMVVSKINGLAVEDVEGLLMRVIHRHLKWINVFGAILGFFIGMLQILTRFL